MQNPEVFNQPEVYAEATLSVRQTSRWRFDRILIVSGIVTLIVTAGVLRRPLAHLGAPRRMSRPDHLSVPNTPEGIRRINESQDAYDRDPEAYERREREAREDLYEEDRARQEANAEDNAIEQAREEGLL